MTRKNHNFIDLIGQRFGRLVVAERHGLDAPVKWRCQCDCGNSLVVDSQRLRIGKTKSCGCLRTEQIVERSTKHGHGMRAAMSSTYRSWASMKGRCYIKTAHAYEMYGGKGITICDRWLESFDNFLEDMGERPKGTSIDRIDNSKGYEPGNCRWATRDQQANNKGNNLIVITADGRFTVSEFAEKYGLKRKAARDQLSAGRRNFDGIEVLDLYKRSIKREEE